MFQELPPIFPLSFIFFIFHHFTLVTCGWPSRKSRWMFTLSSMPELVEVIEDTHDEDTTMLHRQSESWTMFTLIVCSFQCQNRQLWWDWYSPTISITTFVSTSKNSLHQWSFECLSWSTSTLNLLCSQGAGSDLKTILKSCEDEWLWNEIALRLVAERWVQ